MTRNGVVEVPYGAGNGRSNAGWPAAHVAVDEPETKLPVGVDTGSTNCLEQLIGRKSGKELKMKALLIALALMSISSMVSATQERTMPLGDVVMEQIKIEGRIQTWTLQKDCIDGQAYLLSLGVGALNGISASFKGGRPEQCVVKTQASAIHERILPLAEVSIEQIKIEGRIQTWTLHKVCIDGQGYLLSQGVGALNGVSASFKDGKPEQCVVKTQK